VRLGEEICRTPKDFKCWSQNLGHDSPLTSFISYGDVDVHIQGEVILGLGKNETKEEKLDRLINLLEQKK
jgi:integrase/recombinase XerD